MVVGVDWRPRPYVTLIAFLIPSRPACACRSAFCGRSESKRKTANLVAIRKGERTFGLEALHVAVKYPQNGFRYLSLLLGMSVSVTPLWAMDADVLPETCCATLHIGAMRFGLLPSPQTLPCHENGIPPKPLPR